MRIIKTQAEFRAYVAELLEAELADTIDREGNYEGPLELWLHLDAEDVAIVPAAMDLDPFWITARGSGRYMQVSATCADSQIEGGLNILIGIYPDPQGAEIDVDI